MERPTVKKIGHVLAIVSLVLMFMMIWLIIFGPVIADRREDKHICDIRHWHWTWATMTCSEYDLGAKK